MSARIELTGKKFGKLLVLGQVGKRNHLCWDCVCDCGTQVSVEGPNLRSGHTTHCGCAPSWAYSDPQLAAKKHIFRQYKRNAASKKRCFALDFEIFTALILGDCHFCGGSPTNLCSPYFYKKSGKPRHNVSSIRLTQSTIAYNGIDRLDSDKGYTPENSVSCCKPCNIAKHNMKAEDFIAWARRLVKHQDTLTPLTFTP